MWPGAKIMPGTASAAHHVVRKSYVFCTRWTGAVCPAWARRCAHVLVHAMDVGSTRDTGRSASRKNGEDGCARAAHGPARDRAYRRFSRMRRLRMFQNSTSIPSVIMYAPSMCCELWSW